MLTNPKTATREEWLAARLDLLKAEKELTRRSDELARRRQRTSLGRIDKDYRFETGEGTASLADLFKGRSQSLIYHFMFGPDYSAGCPSCSSIADGFNGIVVHLENHDVAFSAVSRAPLASCKPTRSVWGGRFRGRRRRTATSTSNSTSHTPRSSMRRRHRLQFSGDERAAGGRGRCGKRTPVVDKIRGNGRSRSAGVWPGGAGRERVRA